MRARLLAACALVSLTAGAARADDGCPPAEPAPVSVKGLGAPGQAVRLGLIADPRDPSAPTVANLQRFSNVFRREHVAAVIALGGLGSTADDIAKTIVALKDAGAPVLALPGGREPALAFHEAIEKSRAQGVNVVDLGRARAVAGEGLAVLALPGDRWPAPGGCRAQPRELPPLDEKLAQAGKPALLVAHTPPRGGGPDGVAWAPAGGDDGDAELARLLPSLKAARVGAFAAPPGAAGRIYDGTARVADGAWAERLWIAVGAADAMARHHGQAMLLELADGKARAKVIR